MISLWRLGDWEDSSFAESEISDEKMRAPVGLAGPKISASDGLDREVGIRPKALRVMGLLTSLWDFRVVCLNAPNYPLPIIAADR